MTDIYHLPKSYHPSWHRKRRSNDPRVDDEVSFQSPCNDMAISFPGSNSTAPAPGLDNDQTVLPREGQYRQMPTLCPQPPPPPPLPPGLYIDTCISLQARVPIFLTVVQSMTEVWLVLADFFLDSQVHVNQAHVMSRSHLKLAAGLCNNMQFSTHAKKLLETSQFHVRRRDSHMNADCQRFESLESQIGGCKLQCCGRSNSPFVTTSKDLNGLNIQFGLSNRYFWEERNKELFRISKEN